MPAIRDADLTVHVTGGTATVNLGRGTVEVTPGRKLNIASGVFEMPDTHLKPAAGAGALSASTARVPAAAALLASDALRDDVGLVARSGNEPRHHRRPGQRQHAARQATSPKMPPTYTITADLTNFAADKLLMGQKVEAAALARSAHQRDGYQIKGDVKINGTPATIEMSQKKGDADARFALAGEARRGRAPPARHRFRRRGHRRDSGQASSAVSAATARTTRMAVEADLTPVKIDNLLPGWVKPAGKPAHATYTLTKTGQTARFDDLSIDGVGRQREGLGRTRRCQRHRVG